MRPTNPYREHPDIEDEECPLTGYERDVAQVGEDAFEAGVDALKEMAESEGYELWLTDYSTGEPRAIKHMPWDKFVKEGNDQD